MKISVNLFLVLLLMTTLPLAACGIKPDKVSAPQGEDQDQFPRVYPDPSTFQRPEKK